MRLSTSRRLIPALLLAAALGLAPAQAATITVDSDTDDGTGGCTLREAVESANTNSAVGGCTAGASGSDDIVFDAGVTLVQLGSQITIASDLTITGNGAAVTTVLAAAGARIFQMVDETVSISDIRLSSAGSTSASGYPVTGGAVAMADAGSLDLVSVTLDNHIVSTSGGAVFIGTGGELTALDVTFSGNRARGDGATQGGGAIYTAGGFLSVDLGTFTDNRAIGAAGSGGAIAAQLSSADVDLTDCVFTLNRAQRAGGAIEQTGGLLDVVNTDFDQNTAGPAPGNGGAIHTSGPTTTQITNGTATGNRAAAEGGAFWVGSGGSMTVTGTTVSDNFAFGDAADTGGGGLFNDGGTLAVTNATVSGNSAPGAAGSGGGVFANGGSTTITGTTVSGNTASRAGGGLEVINNAGVTVNGASDFDGNATGNAPGNGGAIHVGSGFLVMTESTVRNNRAAAEGGGVWTGTSGSADIRNTEVTGNRALLGGGAFQQPSSTGPGPDRAARTAAKSGLVVGTQLRQSLVFDNDAQRGGGVYALGDVRISNSTIAGNRARFGGGVYSEEAEVVVRSATIARNTARTAGGGFYNTDPNNGGQRFVSLRNTIVSDNTAGFQDPNLRGRFESSDYNLIGTTPPAAAFAPLANDQVGTDPLLEMLADNGGPTRTLALGAGSPAIDAGDSVFSDDQRGEPRTDGSDDVGAFEAAAAPTAALVISGVIDGPLTGGLPKAIELYVLEDIADLSAYGVGVANNGGGTDGEEFTFPADAATAGEFIYVTNSATGFSDWFGFAADYVSSSVDSNGDDAYELFFNDSVVDVIGDINTDGTGQPWEYLDGWAYREDGTGPDGSTFVIGNWSFSGPDALDGETSNATAATPFPTGTYSPVASSSNRAAALATAADAPVSLTASPNPFSTRATASFSVAEAQAVTVALYDVTGRRVQTLFTGPAEAASPVTVAVDGSSLAAGVYVIVLEGERVRSTRPVTVVR